MARAPSPPRLAAPASTSTATPRPASVRLQALLERAAMVTEEGRSPDEIRERQVERKVVGLSLESELRNLAARVGGGLALHHDLVRTCVRLLELGGELSKAARLLSDAGLAREAADMAERSGD